MNIESSINKIEIKDKLKTIINSKTEQQQIERDSLILQASYLSEIERLTKEKGINRKDIALKIKTSPSYLTQVFRGDKPLNFLTLAKIKRALDLRFDLKASFESEKKAEIENIISFNTSKQSYQLYAIRGSKPIETKPLETNNTPWMSLNT